MKPVPDQNNTDAGGKKNAAATAPRANTTNDLEIKDAQIIFDAVWNDLEHERGRENLRFPKELLLLGGAPGSGKGTHANFIQKTRGFTCEPIVMSSLLASPEARRIKESGNMVGDREVVGLLMRELLKPEYADGVILDGFPRTQVQVECMKMLVAKMDQLRAEFFDTPLHAHFRKPTIHIMVLFVDEKTSVERQLQRGREILQHNEEVRRTGIGELLEERSTDFDVPLARHRYRVFKEQTWAALQSLKENFNYHFVISEGSIAEVDEKILAELRYQSSLELDPRTYDRVRTLPLASDIIVHARQDLVKRLDSYETEHAGLFERVVSFIEKKLMPIVIRHAISGRADINSEDPLFDDPLALAMLIDTFSERGYHAVVDLRRIEVPESVDLATGIIKNRVKKVHHIHVHFQGAELRR
ncbi:nucleoside monophosphate kinase [Ereboglobus luteus]|uniref:Adenylate kinase n=1 Tax=Ereboglobus luteus TaxID=1796921 RepID=A0A2U8DZL3_9BACT|nr:nucleoside monophosphate kinase [Ereboglobus luteus]AWI08036.1 adenylate kinase [Ereboglobus luteus]